MLLSLFALLALQQPLAPTERICVRGDCGPECEASPGRAECALTTKGACITSAGKRLCFDPPIELLARSDVATATCVVSAGSLACGYNCVTSGGKAACARTPAGACDVRGGAPLCADPPPDLWLVEGPVPPMTCEVRGTARACGYHCIATASEVRCATTPLGACARAGNNVACADPPPSIVRSLGKRTPQAQCLTSGSQVRCGYNCITASGQFFCAKTPLGRCEVVRSEPRCTDPPLSP